MIQSVILDRATMCITRIALVFGWKKMILAHAVEGMYLYESTYVD